MDKQNDREFRLARLAKNEASLERMLAVEGEAALRDGKGTLETLLDAVGDGGRWPTNLKTAALVRRNLRDAGATSVERLGYRDSMELARLPSELQVKAWQELSQQESVDQTSVSAMVNRLMPKLPKPPVIQPKKGSNDPA